MAVAAEHPLARAAAERHPDVAEFVEQCRNSKVAEAEMATMEKKGIDTGFKAINPPADPMRRSPPSGSPISC